MKNPRWERDEVILALDLYFKLSSGQINSTNPDIIALSKVLNKLPIHKNVPDNNTFRNANGVSIKLSNFLAIDPEYLGKGMVSFSRLDKQIFNEFNEKRDELNKIASRIKKAVENPELNIQLYKIDDDEIDQINNVREGKVVYKLHKFRERDQTINKKKKDKYFLKNGKLDCEVCGFDFNDKYGELGKGYIECHHKIPLSEIDGESNTSENDLVLVCANCHRMLHREINTLTVEALKKRIDNCNN